MWRKVLRQTQEKPQQKTVNVSNRQRLLDAIKEDGTKRNVDYAKQLGTSEGHISIMLSDMRKSKTIKQTGNPHKGNRKLTAVASTVYKRKRATTKKATKKARSDAGGKFLKHGEGRKRVLKFITNNEDKLVTFGEISQQTGVPVSSVHQTIVKLVKEKVIVSSDKNSTGHRRYWLYESIENGPQASVKESTDTATPSKNNKAVMALLEQLVMEYVQETRSTDVLEFLNWLERLEKLK